MPITSANDSLGWGSADNAKEDYDNLVASLSSVDKKYQKAALSFENYQKMLTTIANQYGVKRNEVDKWLDSKSAEEKGALQRRAIDATMAYEANSYKKANISQKAEMQKQRADALASKRKEVDEKYELEWQAAKGDSKKRRELTNQHKRDTLDLVKEEQKARDRALAIQKSQVSSHFEGMKEKFDNLKDDHSLKSAVSLAVELTNFDANTLAAIAEEQKKAYQLAKDNLNAEEANRQQLLDAGYSKDSKAVQEADARIAAAQREKDSAAIKNAITEGITKVANKFDETFEEAEGILTRYKGVIDARLQGSEKNYDDVMNTISSNLSLSPFVKTQDVIEAMKEASDQGIAYNIEQRAFLSTISDKIANTFDAFDSNLTRLIRLQQADTTAARLGMEASLTKFLNGMFQDTSYLNSLSDSVAAALIDANSTLSRDASAEFEYIVQKWLGSLSALGMSEGTINQIAQGINYLATGDVTSLASNTQLQTLFAMSAANAGIEYSQLLIDGLNASNTNKLLESMVTYLKDIAEKSDNQVVRAAYGDIFNMSMSDMKAITNLSKGDIASIASNSLSYRGMMSELQNQFSQLTVRTSISEMLNNLYNNAVFGVAEDMVSNPATYSMYKMLNFMEGHDIDINIPFINAMGFGVDLNTSVRKLMKMGVGLSSAFSLIGNIFEGLTSKGGLNLDSWNSTEFNSRGSGMSFSTAGQAGGVSGSTYVASGNSTDIKNSTISSATDDAEESKKITNKNAEPEYTIADIYKAVIKGSEGDNWLRVEEKLLGSVYMDTGTNFLHTQDARMVFEATNLRVYDQPLRTYLNDTMLPSLNNKIGSIDSQLEEVFGNNPLVADSRLKAYSQVINPLLKVHDDKLDGTIMVSDSGLGSVTSALSALSSTMGSTQTVRVTGDVYTRSTVTDIYQSVADRLRTQQTVSLTAGTTVSIDKKTILEAFREALGLSSTSSIGSQENTLAKLVSLFTQGDAKVKVSNGMYEKIYVDTTSGSTLANLLDNN